MCEKKNFDPLHTRRNTTTQQQQQQHKTLRDDDDVNDDVIKGRVVEHQNHHYHHLFTRQMFLPTHQNATTHDGGASSSYDEVDLEDMGWDEALKAYTYACPVEIFSNHAGRLHDGEEIARCPSCSLILTVVYDPDDLSPLVSVVIAGEMYVESVKCM